MGTAIGAFQVSAKVAPARVFPSMRKPSGKLGRCKHAGVPADLAAHFDRPALAADFGQISWAGGHLWPLERMWNISKMNLCPQICPGSPGSEMFPKCSSSV